MREFILVHAPSASSNPGTGELLLARSFRSPKITVALYFKMYTTRAVATLINPSSEDAMPKKLKNVKCSSTSGTKLISSGAKLLTKRKVQFIFKLELR